MVGLRWGRRLGPGVAALGALAVVATVTLGAQPASWDPPPCGGAPALAAGGTGAWARSDPTLDGGRLAGQRLAVGASLESPPRVMALPGESFVAGAFGRAVLIGADDGATSTVRLLDPVLGCAWTVLRTDEVVRHATVSPNGRELVTFAVDRATRADLGVTVRPLGGGTATPLLGPIGDDPVFGPTWTTDLRWSVEGDELAVQSCAALACRTRVVDVQSGRVRSIEMPGVGEILGLASGRIFAYGACSGLPCPLLSIPMGGGPVRTLAADAGFATLASDAAGRAVLVHELRADGGPIAVVAIDGRPVTSLAPDPLGRRLVAGPARSSAIVDAPAGSVALAPDGRPPVDGPLAPLVRRLADGAVLSLPEVSR